MKAKFYEEASKDNSMANNAENSDCSHELKDHKSHVESNFSLDNLNRTIESQHNSSCDISSRSPSLNNRSLDSYCLNIENDIDDAEIESPINDTHNNDLYDERSTTKQQFSVSKSFKRFKKSKSLKHSTPSNRLPSIQNDENFNLNTEQIHPKLDEDRQSHFTQCSNGIGFPNDSGFQTCSSDIYSQVFSQLSNSINNSFNRLNGNSNFQSFDILEAKKSHYIADQSQFINPQNLCQEMNSNKVLNVCCVCGDRASGKHYGVLSCDGCRGFFKRSIRGNMEYSCKENNSCVIDVSRRNQCQACRLRKCLEVRMNRDAVQHQRPPRSLQVKRELTQTNHIEVSPTENCISHSKTSTCQLQTISEQTHQNLPNNLGSPRFSPYNISSTTRNNRTTSNQIEKEIGLSPKNNILQQQVYGFTPSTAAFPKIPTQANPLPWNAFSTDFFMSNPQAYAMAAVAAASLHSNIIQNQNYLQTNKSEMLNFPVSSLCSLKNKLESVHPKQINDSSVSSNNSVNCSYLNSSVNCSSVSSGYSSTCDEIPTINSSKSSSNADKGKYNMLIQESAPEEQSNNYIEDESAILSTDSKTQKEESVEKSVKNNNLGHNIMNWIKNSPSLSPDNLIELSTRLFFLATRWAKSQRSLLSLSLIDQNLLLSENLNELFALTAAESKSIVNEKNKSINQEKREMIESFIQTLQSFHTERVDPMEFYLLKSIALFKSGTKNLQEKRKVEIVQEECFMSLFNYNKLNHPNYPRFGKILMLYSDLRKFSNSKLIEELFSNKI